MDKVSNRIFSQRKFENTEHRLTTTPFHRHLVPVRCSLYNSNSINLALQLQYSINRLQNIPQICRPRTFRTYLPGNAYVPCTYEKLSSFNSPRLTAVVGHSNARHSAVVCTPVLFSLTRKTEDFSPCPTRHNNSFVVHSVSTVLH